MASSSAGQLNFKFVRSASAPAKTGNVFGVWGPWPTKAAAQAAFNNNSYQGKPVTTVGDSPKTPGQSTLQSLLGIPALHDTRDLVIRTVKVVLGVALIIIGLVEIARPGQILSKLPPVIPV